MTRRFGGVNNAGVPQRYHMWMVWVHIHQLDMLGHLKAQHGYWMIVSNRLSWYCRVSYYNYYNYHSEHGIHCSGP